MKAIWTLARKDLRLLLRDPKAAIILLVMPFVFILVLGISLGEGFGQKPDDRLRVSVVDQDGGYQRAQVRQAVAWLALTPGSDYVGGPVAAAVCYDKNRMPDFPQQAWSKRVLMDLGQSAGIRVELIASREEGKRLVDGRQRSAVIVFGPEFSVRVAWCSFLAEGINPFFRDGVDIKSLDAEVLQDQTQLVAASIIEQVAQGTLLRVVLPWMIGQAFAEIGQPKFVERLSKDKQLKVNVGGLDLRTVLKFLPPEQKKNLAGGMQNSLQGLFPNYNLTAKTWTALTRSTPHTEPGKGPTEYTGPEGSGLLKRGAMRYQLLVPSYIVMFAFFLVLTVGWLFVAERRQGTLKRLRAAPLFRAQILLGKLLPCYLVSVFQGLFLLAAGKLVFSMRWGPDPWLLLPVVLTTSLAAMGMALLVAAMARTESQVSIYGTLLVLVLAGISGCLMGDRAMMPEEMQQLSRVTPHAWALDAYKELLANPGAPNLEVVGLACAVLTAFGLGFLLLAWGTLKLEQS
jgi:ABC-type Na+ efflux pump permease subunit